MARKKKIKILFIGNSHTYYHDLPAWVALMAKEEGYECDVTMLAHGGWYLHQHVEEPDVRFNIKFGHYDYVVLQEHSHPFDDVPGYIEAATTLVSWIREAGSTPVIYGTWAMKAEEEVQATMNHVNRKLAEDLDALYAPVGESWWPYKASWPDIEMYDEDGGHASEHGIEFAAKIIWSTIETVLAMGNNSIVRKHIVFFGYVQGVGFRYRARHAADLYGCTGWVRNEWDGSVSMEIQGEESKIDQVILAIERGTYVRIENMEVKTIPAVEHDYGFRTR